MGPILCPQLPNSLSLSAFPSPEQRITCASSSKTRSTRIGAKCRDIRVVNASWPPQFSADEQNLDREPRR
jgi:hypothetical protein